MDDSEFLYKLSVRLDCTTYKVFLLVINQEKKKKENYVDSLLEQRTETQLARAFDENYIKCGYVPRFVVDHCRIMLSRRTESTKAIVRHTHSSVTESIRAPRSLSFEV